MYTVKKDRTYRYTGPLKRTVWKHGKQKKRLILSIPYNRYNIFVIPSETLVACALLRERKRYRYTPRWNLQELGKQRTG